MVLEPKVQNTFQKKKLQIQNTYFFKIHFEFLENYCVLDFTTPEVTNPAMDQLSPLFQKSNLCFI